MIPSDFNLEPTSKAKAEGNFLSVYDIYLDKLLGSNIDILELGVLRGRSINIWRQLFGSNSNIVGIDINFDMYEFDKDISNITLIQGSQVDTILCKSLGMTYYNGFDIIIEDGGTTQQLKIDTFNLYFPLLKSGGMYFSEHTQHSYEQKNNGGYMCGKVTFVEYLKSLVDHCNMFGKAERGDPYKVLNTVCDLSYFERFIDSIHFHCGICMIRKR